MRKAHLVRAPRLLLPLAAGAALTIAVAWLSANSQTPPPATHVEIVDGPLYFDHITWSCPTSTSELSWHSTLDMSADERAAFTFWSAFAPVALSIKVSAETSGAKVVHYPTKDDRSVTDAVRGARYSLLLQRTFGWPMRSMSCDFVWKHTGAPTVVGGLPLSPSLNAPHEYLRQRALPIRPQWLGFIVNTILSAVFLLLVMKWASVTGRRWRIHRGRCAQCAYDLRGSESHICPECGNTIKRRGVGLGSV